MNSVPKKTNFLLASQFFIMGDTGKKTASLATNVLNLQNKTAWLSLK